ncbi:MAG: tetratricopeptide repeat protein [Rhodobacteraceae bacterium]|nr:tetratricopeptide repeat protein [Paracoccaceae bacterium]
MRVDPLTKLAITYGTDKFGYHDYTPNYYKLFKHLRNKPLRLLEIGVGGYQDADRGGESLEVWRDFFPEAQIVGIDIQKKEMDLGPRVQILQGSQVDPDFLADLVRDHGPFDIIIDDGSHQNEHVVTSFNILYPTLADGGIYVVEDVQTSFFPRFGGTLEMTQPNSVGYFAALSAGFDAPDRPLGEMQIAAVERFHNMIAMHRDASAKGPGPWLKTRAQEPARILDLCLPEAPALEVERLKNAHLITLRRGYKGEGAVFDGNPGSTRFLKSLIRDHGPFDVVVDRANSGENAVAAFETLYPALPDGSLYLVKGAPGTAADDPAASYFADVFTQIDHREIVVNFPDAPINPLVREIYALERVAGWTALTKAPNDYPSNFGFDYQHPQALVAFEAMERVLLEGGKERGLLLFTDIMNRAGDTVRAAKMLKRLEKIGAATRPYYNVAVRQAKIDGDWDAALVMLRQAVELYPDDYRIQSQLGGVLSKAKEWDGAEDALRKAADLAPRDPLVRIQLANVLSRTDRAEEAVEQAKKATELATTHAGHRVQLGRLQINAGHMAEAAATLREAITLNPEIANAHRQLSRALHELGETDEALSVAAQAIDLRPDNAEYRRWQERLATA